ncbi:hypothetical protein K435DRAFT_871685 [Dendrothele bispora CBS 962.96]|uniref:Uncharacterized protein n=1 Tax=Dendrothele bispora (strain CBS 962.96) TaxID=1314807 RepID=A0A4S8L430_DENBC|nr:hypothetical protein K435DRAFT_871685 [Dendrothele bispora CBS 962.96]
MNTFTRRHLALASTILGESRFTVLGPEPKELTTPLTPESNRQLHKLLCNDILCMTAPQPTSIIVGKEKELLPLHELLTDDRPSSLPAFPVSVATPTQHESHGKSKEGKKRDKKRERSERQESIKWSSAPLSIFPRKDDPVLTCSPGSTWPETTSPYTFDYFTSVSPSYWQSFPSNSTLFSHAPPEASRSYIAPREAKASRRSSKSKDARRAHHHHSERTDPRAFEATDGQRTHRHSTDGSGRPVFMFV